MANSSRFVLPMITPPAARMRSTTRRVVGRLPAVENARRTRRRDAARAEVVLDARSARPRADPVRRLGHGVDSVGGGARFVGEHEVERVDVVLARVDPREVLFEHVARAPAAGAHVGRDVDRGHGASPEDPRHAEASVLGVRRRREHLVAARATVEPRRAGTRSRAAAGARWAARRAVSSAETCATWSRIAPSSFVSDSISSSRQREPREERDMFDFGSADPFGHGREATCRGRACSVEASTTRPMPGPSPASG